MNHAYSFPRCAVPSAWNIITLITSQKKMVKIHNALQKKCTQNVIFLSENIFTSLMTVSRQGCYKITIIVDIINVCIFRKCNEWRFAH